MNVTSEEFGKHLVQCKNMKIKNTTINNFYDEFKNNYIKCDINYDYPNENEIKNIQSLFYKMSNNKFIPNIIKSRYRIYLLQYFNSNISNKIINDIFKNRDNISMSK